MKFEFQLVLLLDILNPDQRQKWVDQLSFSCFWWTQRRYNRLSDVGGPPLRTVADTVKTRLGKLLKPLPLGRKGEEFLPRWAQHAAYYRFKTPSTRFNWAQCKISWAWCKAHIESFISRHPYQQLYDEHKGGFLVDDKSNEPIEKDCVPAAITQARVRLRQLYAWLMSCFFATPEMWSGTFGAKS